MVTVLYNPRSARRTEQLEEAATIFKAHRPGSTPVGIGTAVGTDEEVMAISDLDHFLQEDINMRSTVIIGNSTTQIIRGVPGDAARLRGLRPIFPTANSHG